MGCDIHAYVETGYVGKRDDKMSWFKLCDFRFNRNYLLFALMAGVRRYNYLPSSESLEEELKKRGVETLDDPLLSDAEREVIVRDASDSGITKGQPSFEEKGAPKDMDWSAAEAYTLYVDDNADDDDDHACTRENATNWLNGGSSEAWDLDQDGKVIRITHPDWHTPSWLSADEMEIVAVRMRAALEGYVSEHKETQQKCVAWAKKALESAIRDNDPERIAFAQRELEREERWESHDPLRNETLVKVEGLAQMMKHIEQDGRFKARVVFWFDN